MSSEFEAKKIKEASHYLEDKLNLFKKGGAITKNENAYELEDKKSTIFQRFVSSIFNK